MSHVIVLNGSEEIERIFGYQPTFHDSEVLSLGLDRGGPSMSIRLPSAVRIRAENRAERIVHYEVTLCFDNVDNVKLEGFNHQNVVGSIELSSVENNDVGRGQAESRIFVNVYSIFGLGGSFTCSKGEIMNVRETDLQLGHPR